MIQFSDIAKYVTLVNDDQEQKGSWHCMDGYLCFEGGFLVRKQDLPAGLVGWFLAEQPRMSRLVANLLWGTTGANLGLSYEARGAILIDWYNQKWGEEPEAIQCHACESWDVDEGGFCMGCLAYVVCPGCKATLQIKKMLFLDIDSPVGHVEYGCCGWSLAANIATQFADYDGEIFTAGQASGYWED